MCRKEYARQRVVTRNYTLRCAHFDMDKKKKNFGLSCNNSWTIVPSFSKSIQIVLYSDLLKLRNAAAVQNVKIMYSSLITLRYILVRLTLIRQTVIW